MDNGQHQKYLISYMIQCVSNTIALTNQLHFLRLFFNAGSLWTAQCLRWTLLFGTGQMIRYDVTWPQKIKTNMF